MTFILPILLLSFAADPWHLPGWEARAVVAITNPASDSASDTAVVRVLLQGGSRADGNDLRVLDASGRPVPFQVLHHDPARDALIAFRATAPRTRYLVYFANPNAPAAPERIALDPRPGAGPPKAAWVPHAGLVYQTLRRPEGPNPKSPDEMAKLLAASPGPFGARTQRKIADGYNPFGPSDNYLSIYRGWIRVPKAGPYQFCTISNEASFSFLDGKELIQWPGRHTIDRGTHGEKHAAVELSAGMHYLEYYHEEVTLQQMAYLGWRTSSSEGPFEAIPESAFPAPHQGGVASYESPRGPLLRFTPHLTGSIWPEGRSDGQYTMARFSPHAGFVRSAGVKWRWSFGDGETSNAAEPTHVYLATGRYNVTLTAEDGPAKQTASWPLDVFEIEHVTEEFAQGHVDAYAKIADAYDREKLDESGLRELTLLQSEAGEPARSLESGRIFVRRFPAATPAGLSHVRRAMAESALKLGEGSLDEAIANLEASVTDKTPPAEAFDVLARLIRLLAIDRGQPERAVEVAKRVERIVKTSKLDVEAIKSYRRALIASGDAFLWQGKIDEARDAYTRSEVITGAKIPLQVRAARVGAYPNAMREFLVGKDLAAATELVDRWEETFPTEKVSGQTFFWRGKILTLQKQYKDAARYLSRSVVLSSGAGYETEARWKLAESYEWLGRRDEARTELRKLVATGLDDSFTRKAREVLGRAPK